MNLINVIIIKLICMIKNYTLNLNEEYFKLVIKNIYVFTIGNSFVRSAEAIVGKLYFRILKIRFNSRK